MNRKSSRLFNFCLVLLFTIVSINAFAQVGAKRDPTEPAIIEVGGGETATPIAIYEAQSIIIGQTRRLALINNIFVKVGGTIGRAKVIAIDRNAVILSDSGRNRTIHLFNRNF